MANTATLRGGTSVITTSPCSANPLSREVNSTKEKAESRNSQVSLAQLQRERLVSLTVIVEGGLS